MGCLEGGGGVTFCHCLSIHSFTQRTAARALQTRTARPHDPTAMKQPARSYGTTPLPTPPPRFASTHRSLSFAWVKSSQTPGLVLDLPPTSAGERESERTSERGGEGEEEPSRSGSGRRAGGRAGGRALLRQERLWIYDLNLAIYEVNATLKCMGIITGRLPR